MSDMFSPSWSMRGLRNRVTRRSTNSSLAAESPERSTRGRKLQESPHRGPHPDCVRRRPAEDFMSSLDCCCCCYFRLLVLVLKLVSTRASISTSTSTTRCNFSPSGSGGSGMSRRVCKVAAAQIMEFVLCLYKQEMHVLTLVFDGSGIAHQPVTGRPC